MLFSGNSEEDHMNCLELQRDVAVGFVVGVVLWLRAVLLIVISILANYLNLNYR